MLLAFGLGGFVSVSHALAADGKSDIVRSIEVNGNRFVETDAITLQIDTKVGDVLDRKKISNDVRRLYATGNFKDIQVEGTPGAEGVRVIYKVTENPLIADFKVTGNSEITYKDMKRKLKLQSGVVFSDSRLRADISTIRKGYIKEGYYRVQVEDQIEELEDGRINLMLKVIEGGKTYIKQIRFVGNDAFNDQILTDEISARESDFMSWITSRDVIDSKKFANDAQMLTQYYQDHGYLDMSVESSQLLLTPDKSSFYLTFSIHEGPIYTVSKVDIQGDTVVPLETLTALLEVKAGEIYSLSNLRKDLEMLTLKVGDEGFAFANVTPLFKRDVAGQTVEITFDVEKGREVYVERIEISGNEKTNDEVIRRELRVDEAERYSATRMKQSKTNLSRSSLLKDHRISMPKGSASDRVNVNVDVTEESTGSFIFGVGFSQLEKALFRAKYNEKNLLGKGYGANVTADVGAKTQNFDVSLSDPYFMGRDINASVNANKSQSQLQQITFYKQNNYGGGVSFGIPITEKVSYGIGYNYTKTNLTDIQPTASLFLRAQAGTQSIGEIDQSISYDTRNSLVGTSSGTFQSLGFKVAGLGGSNKFLESTVTSQFYYPLTDDLTIRAMMGGQIIRGYNNKSEPVYRRYSLGGIGSLRGFDYFGVSLRDPKSKEAVGGDKQVTASLDLFFPLPYVRTAGIRGGIFYDVGTVWGSVNTTVGGQTLSVAEKFSFSRMRTSAGFGIEWMSPVGPVTLSWAKAQRKQVGDLERTFEFGLGRTF
ncbi:MAG: outer membrane protein assembly factor BamA [Zetaproteobacteria bacterium CG1_02_49_23]|nr:MAG: outer membrane protein assembly factor BamA [Zetaproteobacteria bacterium CG1_02_49_23]